MMRPLIFTLYILLFGPWALAQGDTLYVNDTHNLILVFPRPIQRAVTGHPNYSFGFARDTGMRLGLLQGHPGPDSNLLVLTSDGNAYAYYLEYREALVGGHRFIAVENSLGNVSAERALDPVPLGTKARRVSLSQGDSIQFAKGCAFILEQLGKASLKSKRRDGLALRLKAMEYYGRETYLAMELENGSTIDFEVDFVQVFREQGSPGKRSSHQKLPMVPRFKYEEPPMVRAGHKSQFVHVLPKFTLGRKESLMIELRERLGDRRLVLRLR